MDDEKIIFEILQLYPQLPASHILKFLKRTGEAKVKILQSYDRDILQELMYSIKEYDSKYLK